MDYDRTCALLAEATSLLLTSVAQVTDADVRQASLLPGWTRGHVLTHLARNADGLGRLVGWASTGEPAQMYASREQRNADIEAGAGRGAHELGADLKATATSLAEGFAALAVDRRAVAVDNQGHSMRAEVLPWLRLREVSLHSVDLAMGVTCEDIASDVRDRLLAGLSHRPTFADGAPVRLSASDTGGEWLLGDPVVTVRGREADLLCWATGRSSGATLTAEPEGPLPVLPSWG